MSTLLAEAGREHPVSSAFWWWSKPELCRQVKTGHAALYTADDDQTISPGGFKEFMATSTVNPNKALWEKGDFTAIAVFMRDAGREFARSLNVKPGMKVLELGCGDGNTALPLAQLGADVLGIDIARNLIEAGNRRAAEAGIRNLRIQEGDAANLAGIPDASFDLTLSVFGAMFSPRPYDVAREMVRVTRPGGRVVMGNWIPGDPTFVSLLLKICMAHTPPPPEGFVSPMLWGVESHVLDRFGKAGVPPERISMTRERWSFESSDRSPADFITLFEKYYGPTMNAVDAARAKGTDAQLHDELVAMANAENRARNGGMSIDAALMRVTVQL